MAAKVPVIDQREANTMSLAVLKRLDPQIEELLATAGHVALYDFDIPSKRWVQCLCAADRVAGRCKVSAVKLIGPTSIPVQSRKDVEGSLFLVKRRAQPRFQFVILNKKSAVATDNFVEDVHGGFQCEVQKPYVLYRNRANEVVGIWFYDDADCDRISLLLQRIASTFAAPAEAAAGIAASSDVAAAPAGDDCTKSDGEAGGATGDESFWDRRLAAAASQQAQELAAWTDDQPSGAVQTGLPSSQKPAAHAPPGGSGNDLARLFAGIKMRPGAAGPQPAPAAAAMPAQPIMLLTPQLLQQEAATTSSDAGRRSAAAANGGAGSMLLQSLLRGSQQQPSPAHAPPAPINAAEADRALPSRVSRLLSSLASNDDFCGLLASELTKAGLG